MSPPSRESGVRPLLHCLAVEVIKEGDVVKGIVTESKSGRQAILADRVVDCTGDADIAYLAGAKCTKVRRDSTRITFTRISVGFTTLFIQSVITMVCYGWSQSLRL